ncbi:hypothetical protein [Halobellus captivus]|uniref:hypothetical protein n=1 Tax=Halobellus captivus TaxID=2592614 RepID=UPI00119E8508|nr:hypothetical protein [Halobellus captivus]
MAATTTRRRSHFAACALALVVLLAAAVSVAAAADTTDIAVAPAADGIQSGETTTVDVIVENADGGVGALNASITLSNPDAATIEEVTIHGDPSLENVSERPDGVDVSAALADTADTGEVTIVTVVLRGGSPGETAIDVNTRVLGDEDGSAYTVADTERPTLSVIAADGSGSGVDGESVSGSGDSAGSGSNDSSAPESGGPSDAIGADGETTADGNGGASSGEGAEPSGDSDGSAGDSDGSNGGASAGSDGGDDDSSPERPFTLYGPAGALGVLVIGALVLSRLR